MYTHTLHTLTDSVCNACVFLSVHLHASEPGRRLTGGDGHETESGVVGGAPRSIWQRATDRNSASFAKPRSVEREVEQAVGPSRRVGRRGLGGIRGWKKSMMSDVNKRLEFSTSV